MGTSLDNRHAAYDPQQRAKTRSISYQQRDKHLTIARMPLQGFERPDFHTELCGISSPFFHDPLLLPGPKPQSLETAQYPCPRCDSPDSRPSSLRQHFPSSFRTESNPNSLGWFDGESSNSPGTLGNDSPKTTASPRKGKPSEFGIASSLGYEPGAMMAMSKVERWAALAEKQAESVISTSDSTLSDSTLKESIPDRSSHSDNPVVKKPALRLFITPKKGVRFATPLSRDESVTPARVQQQATPREPKRPRPSPKKARPSHTEITAHLFNSAGLLIPSIPGIDSVTERLFDQGEIMSLRPPRSDDGYYPDGEPPSGSFLMDDWNRKKRKRDDES